jgi:hypothetical protein
MKIYVNGALCTENEAGDSMPDRSFLHHDGMFDWIHFYGARANPLKAHHGRLFDSMRAIWRGLARALEMKSGMKLNPVEPYQKAFHKTSGRLHTK